MNIETKLEEFLPIIESVSKRVAKDYHMVDVEDLKQELICFVLKRMQSDNPLGQPSEVKWSMRSFLTRVARELAFDQKRQHYLIDPQFSYRVGDVREILQTQFCPELWDVIQGDETVEDMVAAHSDVAWALNRLPLKDKEFVAECYLAPKLPSSGTKEYRRLRDLIVKITNIVNHYTRADEGEGPGRRKVISNSRASAMVDDNSFFVS